MRTSDWSSDVCSSDLEGIRHAGKCVNIWHGGFLHDVFAPTARLASMAFMGRTRGFLSNRPVPVLAVAAGVAEAGLCPNTVPADEPPEQPLPNENPHPPFRTKAFSAYLRCVVGITHRSSSLAIDRKSTRL